MPKTIALKGEKQNAKAANRHAIVSPAANRERWARTLTTKRVSDLFKTAPGLRGHWQQLQQEITRGNKNFELAGRTDAHGKELIKFIAEGVVKAAKDAKFDFNEQVLKFNDDMGWLKIKRVAGKISVRSKP